MYNILPLLTHLTAIKRILFSFFPWLEQHSSGIHRVIVEVISSSQRPLPTRHTTHTREERP
jgi:hypothetical protein